MFEVIEPGLLTTVQDLGRFGWYHIGMPPSGAMDNFSFRVGNLLVGNDESAAGLEITFTGPTLTVTTDTIVAVTGAELSFRINRLVRVIQHTRWSAAVWPQVRVQFRKALALRSEIQQAGWFN